MRGLAEFVMSGRRQAITAVLLLGLIPVVNLLNPVLIGLVMLRKGPRDAAFILVWALLPAIAWASLGDFDSLLMLVGVSSLCWLLREGNSWPLTLLAAAGVGIAGEILLHLQPQSLLALYDLLAAGSAGAQNAQLVSREVFLVDMPSRLGPGYMALAIGMVIMARWMQAMLYNPGGFRQEFHALRLSQNVVLILVGLMLLTTVAEMLRSAWSMYFALPIVVSGLALLHAVVARQGMSGLWLVALYLLLPWVLQLVLLLALVDSWYDFRRRLGGGAEGS